FYDIGQKLSQATKEQKKRAELYKICYDLETRWKQHHKTYKQLLWRSREVAGEARFVVDDFREVFLPCLRDPATTLPQRQQLAQEHIEKLEDKARTSENLSQKFLDFVEVLDGYMADFSRAVERLGYREQTEKCRIVENKLDSAKAALECVSKEVKALGWRFARDVFVTGVLGLLTVLAPVWGALLGAAATGISLYSNIQDLQPVSRVKRVLASRKCNAIKNELDLERACLSQMVNLQSALEDAAPIVHDVTSKLGAFARVWAAIAADIRQIIHHSQSCSETETSHVRKNTFLYSRVSLTDVVFEKMLFTQRVEMLEALYQCLSDALRYYQVTVRMPE
ncbi:hypothetical protein PAXINDRAFT_22325, partial [Paxillus involutus ATCC 200175]